MKDKSYYLNQEGENIFYVYIHRRLSDGKPFYVGKGKGDRAWYTDNRNQFWKNVESKHGFYIDIVFDDLDEETAFQCEKDIILELKYFGYTLCNLTDGGEGTSGRVATEEQRHRLSTSLKMSEALKKSAEARKGIPRPPHVVEALRKSSTGRKITEDTRKKMSDAKKGVAPPSTSTIVYTFHHISGEMFTGTRLELSKYSGVSTKSITKLFAKSPRKAVSNWSLEKWAPLESVKPKKEKQKPATHYDPIIYTFYHISGSVFIGTKRDFKDLYGFDLGCLFCKTKSRRDFFKGWSLDKSLLSNYYGRN